jgi:hypothetical protein
MVVAAVSDKAAAGSKDGIEVALPGSGSREC